MAIDSNAQLAYADAGGAQVGQFNTYNVSAGNVPLSNTASINDSVKDNVGNTALNVSAGARNQQANGLAIAKADNATLVVAAMAACRSTATKPSALFLLLVNSSTLTDSVKGNVGNVGVNLSAGIGNQQVNNVSLAVR